MGYNLNMSIEKHRLNKNGNGNKILPEQIDSLAEIKNILEGKTGEEELGKAYYANKNQPEDKPVGPKSGGKSSNTKIEEKINENSKRHEEMKKMRKTGSFEKPTIKEERQAEKGYKNQESKKYWSKINEIVELIKNGGGITKVVIHGNPIFDRPDNFEKLHGKKGWNGGYESLDEKKFIDEGPAIEINNDFDTNGALLLLKELAESSPEFFAEGAVIEIIPKGTNETFTKTKFTQNNKQVERKIELILYIDVGNKNISIETINEKGQSNVHIYADHHGEGGGYETSATQIVYDIGKAGNMFKEGKKISKEKLNFYQRMSQLINKVDNLNFIDELTEKSKEEGKKRLVDINYLRENFAYSLYSLSKFLPFETVLEILGKLDQKSELVTNKYLTKNNKIRNWSHTFHPNEINLGKFGDMKVKHEGKEKTLRELIKENQKEIDRTIDSEKMIFNYMKESGINTTSPLVGKFIYRNYFKIEKFDKKKKKTYKETPFVKDNIAYIVARGLGADSFVSYSGADGKIFINSNGKFDLMQVWKQLNILVPGYPKPVRNKFLFPPKDAEMLALIKEKIPEEVFLLILNGEEMKKVNKNKITQAEKTKNKVVENESTQELEIEQKTAHINTDESAEDEESLVREEYKEPSGIIGSGRDQMSKEEFSDFINNESKPKTKKERREENKKKKIEETLEQKTTFEPELNDQKIQTLAEKISSGEKLSPEDEAIKEKIGDILNALLNKENSINSEKENEVNLKNAIIEKIEKNEVIVDKNQEAIANLLKRKEEIEKRLQEIEDEKIGINTYRKKKNWLQRTWRKIFNF